jgi:uroporphyrinogen decarboxylase
VCIEISGFFGWCRSLMGLENFLIALYKDPGLVHDMMEFRAQFATEFFEPVVENCRVDFALLAEDMAYKNGPHISPKLIREFIVPRYKEETDLLKKHGIDLVFVDSDGDIRLIIPLWLEAGVNGTFPLEVMAGNDAVELRKKYPMDLRMMGNIDKMALIEGKEAIDSELERKLPFLLKEGGYLPTVDHGIPPEIPFEHYRHYMIRLKEYLDAYS